MTIEPGVVILALGHRYTSEVTKHPTATEEGIRTHTSNRCGDTYTEAIPRLTDGTVTGTDENLRVMINGTGSTGANGAGDGNTTAAPATGDPKTLWWIIGICAIVSAGGIGFALVKKGKQGQKKQALLIRTFNRIASNENSSLIIQTAVFCWFYPERFLHND